MGNLCITKTSGQQLHFVNANYYSVNNNKEYVVLEYDKDKIVSSTAFKKEEIKSIDEE